MNNKNLKSWALLSLVVVMLLGACKKEEDFEPGLIGTWVNAFSYVNGEGATRKGEYVLAFGSDNSFVLRSSMYGAYPGQSPDEVSSWTEYQGTVAITDSTLLFTPQRESWWDGFYGDMTPETAQVTTQRIFDDCTYTINGRQLELHYTTYPLDYPESTQAVYIKKK